MTNAAQYDTITTHTTYREETVMLKIKNLIALLLAAILLTTAAAATAVPTAAVTARTFRVPPHTGGHR